MNILIEKIPVQVAHSRHMDGFRFENERNVQSAVLSLRVQAESREPGTTKNPDQEGQENLERKS